MYGGILEIFVVHFHSQDMSLRPTDKFSYGSMPLVSLPMWRRERRDYAIELTRSDISGM
jgi:hypothetical protein